MCPTFLDVSKLDRVMIQQSRSCLLTPRKVRHILQKCRILVAVQMFQTIQTTNQTTNQPTGKPNKPTNQPSYFYCSSLFFLLTFCNYKDICHDHILTYISYTYIRISVDFSILFRNRDEIFPFCIVMCNRHRLPDKKIKHKLVNKSKYVSTNRCMGPSFDCFGNSR